MKEYLEKTERYLNDHLIPFWDARILEPTYGGFQPNYDRHGRRTSVTEKALLCHARTIFAMSHALRLGFRWDRAPVMLANGYDFMMRRLRDGEFGGYLWMVGEDGAPRDSSKVLYGHAFVIYALAEYAMQAGRDDAAREAQNVFDLVLARAADVHHGGFLEHFDRRFRPVSVRPDGALHKSLDTHMHLMEAFTTLTELTGGTRHAQALEQIIGLIFDRMTDPATGTGIAMFTPDWKPIPNEQLGTLWGRDRFPPAGKPPEITSYGHNIELAWLYLHALDVLGVARSEGRPRVEPIFEHTCAHGVDWEMGGVYCEGHRAGGVTETNKEFWQQAEALVGFLDAWRLTRDDKYLRAFRNVHDFVFGKMINWEVGEWFPLLSREGKVLRDEMGYSWKTFYHVMRSMCLVVTKLREIVG